MIIYIIMYIIAGFGIFMGFAYCKKSLEYNPIYAFLILTFLYTAKLHHSIL